MTTEQIAALARLVPGIYRLKGAGSGGYDPYALQVLMPAALRLIQARWWDPAGSGEGRGGGGEE